MSIQVKQIDVYGIEARMRKDKSKEGKENWHYVKALKEALTRQQRLTGEAISKVKQQAEEINKLKHSL
jgi:hypothetical protein